MARKKKNDDYNFEEIKLYDDVSLQDILKEIHTKTQSKADKIESFIDKVSGFVHDGDSAAMVMPLLASYIDSSIKNDDTLVKLANVVQRFTKKSVNEDKGDGEGYDSILSKAETEEIIKNAKESYGKVVKM